MEIAILALATLICLAHGHEIEHTSHNKTAPQVHTNVKSIVRYLPKMTIIIAIIISVDIELTWDYRIFY